MKLTTRILALLLVLVMLLPMAVACSEPAVENDPAQDKAPVAGELAQLPETEENADAKALLLELLKQAEKDANSAKVKVKFKGNLNVSFLDPELSYTTDDLVDFVDGDGYLTVPVDELIGMLGENATIFEDLGAILNNTLLGFVENGGYGSLEEMLGGLIDNVTVDSFIAAYGDPSEALSAVLATAVLGGALAAKEAAVHAYDEDDTDLSYCMETITYMTSVVGDYLLRNAKGETSFEDTLEAIAYSGILNIAANGSVCGSDNDYPLYGFYTLEGAVYEILNDIEYNKESYDGEGNYNLEVYLPAIEGQLENILLALTGGYADDQITALIAEELAEYLGSENGPVAEIDLCDLLLSFGCAALTLVYTSEIMSENYIDGEDTAIGFYHLSEEKWYTLGDNYGDLVAVPENVKVNVVDHYYIDYSLKASHGEYEEEPTAVYAAIVNGMPTMPDSYDRIVDMYGAENIVSVYFVYFGDEAPVTLDDNIKSIISALFGAFSGGIGTELTEDDKAMTSAAVLAYLLTYPDQGNKENKLMDADFAEKFILAALDASVADVAGAFESIAAILGIEDEDDTDDVDPVADFVSEWVINLDPEEFADTEIEDQILGLICYVLADEDVANALGNWYYDDEDVPFSPVFAVYLYAKYIGGNEITDMIFEGEELEDGLPLVVAIAIVSEYAYLYSDYTYIDVRDSLVDYYDLYSDEDAMFKIVNYEDILVLMLALDNGDFEYVVNTFKYPFDYIESMMFSVLLNNMISDKYYDEESDDNQAYYELSNTAQILTEKIYNVNGNEDMYTYIAILDIIWALVGNYEDPAQIDAMNGFKTVIFEMMDEQDLDTLYHYPVIDTITDYIIPAMFEVDAEYGCYELDHILLALYPYESAETVAAISADIKIIYEDHEVLFALDQATVVDFLDNIHTYLSYKDIPLGGLENVIAAIAALENDPTPENIFDFTLIELWGEEYTVLTDVILALGAEDPTVLLAAIDAAKTALADDLVAVGYLRALEAMVTGAQPSVEGMLNLSVILEAMKTQDSMTVYANIIPVLYMTKAEFAAWAPAELVAVREWAEKYYNAYTVNGTVNAVELAIDYLVATNYFDEADIPEATDPAYYDKLAVIYAVNKLYEDEDHAKAVVDAIYRPENLKLHGDTFLEMAEAVVAETPAQSMIQMVYYLLSTKAFLEVEDPSTVDWEKALSYIPELYNAMNEKDIEIGNYAAFSEMLRPVFAEKVNTAFVADVVPYETATEIVYIFTVTGELEHIAVEGDCEFVIEIRVPKVA